MRRSAAEVVSRLEEIRQEISSMAHDLATIPERELAYELACLGKAVDDVVARAKRKE